MRKVTVIERVPAGRCMRCREQRAQSRSVSDFQLCGGCAYEVCPRANVARWQQLHAQYGYNRAA